jgi:hypothetical protein
MACRRFALNLPLQLWPERPLSMARWGREPAGAILGTASRTARIMVRGFHRSPAHVILRRKNFSGHSRREDTCGFKIRYGVKR